MAGVKKRRLAYRNTFEIYPTWCLDVAFEEDKNRTRSRNTHQNLSVLRRIALGVLKKDTAAKLALKNKRKSLTFEFNAFAVFVEQIRCHGLVPKEGGNTGKFSSALGHDGEM
jgi:hypothetical protein